MAEGKPGCTWISRAGGRTQAGAKARAHRILVRICLRASCPFRGYRETSRKIKGDARARGGKRKATPLRILSQLALLATQNGELAHSYRFPSRSNACRAGYIVRKRVKKALSQSRFGMPDCVTYTLRSCESTIFRLHIRKRSCGSSIPHLSLFF